MTAFLPMFKAPGFSSGEWGGGEKNESGAMQMPYFSFSEEVMSFVKTAYRLGWVLQDFNWPEWKDTSEALSLLEPRALDSATAEQLAKLLTVLIRQDRFVEGLLADAFESGLITRIVARAATLLSEIEGDEP